MESFGEPDQMMKTETVSIPVGNDQVSGIISFTEPSKDKTGIIIAHGAGNDMHNPLIVSVAEGWPMPAI